MNYRANRMQHGRPYQTSRFIFLLSRHIKQIFLYLCKINNDELEAFWEADLSFWKRTR